jgi:hypothetical protein
VAWSGDHRYLHIFEFMVESARMDFAFQGWMRGFRSGISNSFKRI